MQLTLRSNHAMRLLMFCAMDTGRPIPVSRIARACNVSEAHLAKIAHHLSTLGFVQTLRGRGGGVRLAKAAAEINLGAVIRATETGPLLTQCGGVGPDACPLNPACRFRSILEKALAAFLAVLDEFSLADLVDENPALRRAAGLAPRLGCACPTALELAEAEKAMVYEFA
jgi:Rrf2 family nitric oxide-sensitive transcriptional repressor